MRGRLLRKFLVVLIILAPIFADTACKKQPKCGCEGDELFTIDTKQATVYFNAEGTSITFQLLTDPYSTFIFCNPGEMFPSMSEAKSGDVLLVSGSAFWECNYLYQSSNSSYQSYYKVYNVLVSEVKSDLYGRK